MKTILLAVGLMLLVTTSVYAGEKEWATFGKIMAGIEGIRILSGDSSIMGAFNQLVPYEQPSRRPECYIPERPQHRRSHDRRREYYSRGFRDGYRCGYEDGWYGSENRHAVVIYEY